MVQVQLDDNDVIVSPFLHTSRYHKSTLVHHCGKVVTCIRLAGNVLVRLAGNVLVRLAGNVLVRLAGNLLVCLASILKRPIPKMFRILPRWLRYFFPK